MLTSKTWRPTSIACNDPTPSLNPPPGKGKGTPTHPSIAAYRHLAIHLLCDDRCHSDTRWRYPAHPFRPLHRRMETIGRGAAALISSRLGNGLPPLPALPRI